MIRRSVASILLVSLFLSIGSHLAVLQAIAWAKMVTNFTARNSFRVSIQKTFDGRHPCTLCLRLKKAAEPADSLAPLRQESKVDWAAPSETPRLFPIHAPPPNSFVFIDPSERFLSAEPPPPKTSFL